MACGNWLRRNSRDTDRVGRMNLRLVRGLGLLATVLFLAGCFTDAATRLAYDIESGVNRMNRQNETRHSIRHAPAESSECAGPYTVQLDKVGALIVWCKDTAGNIVASGSTSYHARFIDTPTTYILDKPAGAILTIDLERRAGRGGGAGGRGPPRRGGARPPGGRAAGAGGADM